MERVRSDFKVLRTGLRSQLSGFVPENEQNAADEEFDAIFNALTPEQQQDLVVRGKQHIPNLNVRSDDAGTVHIDVTKCCVCNGANPQKMRCSKCKREYYCSRRCQNKAWPTHKQSCQASEKQIVQEATTPEMKTSLPCTPLDISDAGNMVQFTVDPETRELKKAFCFQAVPEDTFLSTNTQDGFDFQTFACWMPRLQFDVANNWPLWRTTCFRNRVKQFAVYYHYNRAIVEPKPYFSYDCYLLHGKHMALGIEQTPQPQSIVVPILIAHAQEIARSLQEHDNSHCDA